MFIVGATSKSIPDSSIPEMVDSCTLSHDIKTKATNHLCIYLEKYEKIQIQQKF